MPRLSAETMTDFATRIFVANDLPQDVAEQVAKSLVLSNLSGHDSHGVIRLADYVAWVKRGWVNPHGQLTVVREQSCILILDGDFGFGQVIGRRAMELGIRKAKVDGACIVSLRRSGHLGRIGEFMEQAAAAGLVCFAMTNTHGSGILVAPQGGCERRLSANPLAGSAPRPGGPPIMMDISTCTIAEGKLKVARSRGDSVPPGMFVNSEGQPSTNPEEFYATPPGALLPMAGHKGFALSLMCEIFAGAMTGAGCSKAGVERVANGFMAFLLDPHTFAGEDFVSSELEHLANWVKSSRLQSGVNRIQLPGEPETETRNLRRESGIEIDEGTWKRICDLAATGNVAIPGCAG